VTGASIAGPARTYWLSRQGTDVTVVERAPAFRDGRKTIDVLGAEREAARRLGLEDLNQANTTRQNSFAESRRYRPA